MLPASPIGRIIVGLPVFLLAIVLHELAHGYVAYRLGDDTAKRAGRLTLSPIAHLDPLGALVFVVTSLGGVGFGWAKPVPISISQLRNPGRDEMLVTLAGPGANLTQALLWAGLLRLSLGTLSGPLLQSVIAFCFLGVAMNVMLMMFNLLPIPPLDGSHVAFRLLGIDDPFLAQRLQVVGFIALIVFLNSGLYGTFWNGLVVPVIRLLLP